MTELAVQPLEIAIIIECHIEQSVSIPSDYVLGFFLHNS